MVDDRRKSIERPRTEEELSEEIDAAQYADETHLVRRLCLIRNLYEGDSLAEAGRRVGVSRPTAGRWADRWNENAVDGLDPDFDGGRPPKLSEDQQAALVDVLEADQPWTTREVKLLLEEAYGISYSMRHVRRLLRSFGMNYSKPRPTAPDRPENAEELLDERLQAAIEELDEETDARPDGGYVVGFLDESWPNPTDYRQRLWGFDTVTISKETPVENVDQPVFGFYALNGESVAAVKPDVTTESVGEFFRTNSRDQS